MQLKIGRYTHMVCNKDWVLDNGACYQCITLLHHTSDWLHPQAVTIMGKKQFKQLVKENKLIEVPYEIWPERLKHYHGCKIWKFNVEE